MNSYQSAKNVRYKRFFWRKKASGFSLIELMVVVIVVGILAAVAGPFYSAIQKRAVAAEAFAGCASINRHLDVFEVEKKIPDSGDITSVENGIMSAGLGGTYFSAECYSLDFNTYSDWEITVDGSRTTIADSPAQEILITLRNDGQRSVTAVP